MRRLAKELDTGLASLYVYFRNTAQLHGAVLDELLGAADLSPVEAEGDWRERSRVLASYTRVLFEYPVSLSRGTARRRGELPPALVEGVLAPSHSVPPQRLPGVRLAAPVGDVDRCRTRGRRRPGAVTRWAALRAVRPETHSRSSRMARTCSWAGEDRASWGYPRLDQRSARHSTYGRTTDMTHHGIAPPAPYSVA